MHRLLDGDFQTVLLIAALSWALAVQEWLAWFMDLPLGFQRGLSGAAGL